MSSLFFFERRNSVYKTFVALLSIVWIMDILNLSCMRFLDTDIPINGLAWFLIWAIIPSTTVHKVDDQ